MRIQSEEAGTLVPNWVGRVMVRCHSLEVTSELKCERMFGCNKDDQVIRSNQVKSGNTQKTLVSLVSLTKSLMCVFKVNAYFCFFLVGGCLWNRYMS